MFHVVLVHPEIPPNTGNVIRLCANTGAQLHLIEPLGFPMDHAKMRRAGLDYHEFARVQVHPDWQGFVARANPHRMFALTTRGRLRPSDQRLLPGDCFVFGAESAGLPQSLLDGFPPERLAAPADASRQPQPQPVERGGRRHLRGLAPERLRRRRLSARSAPVSARRPPARRGAPRTGSGSASRIASSRASPSALSTSAPRSRGCTKPAATIDAQAASSGCQYPSWSSRHDRLDVLADLPAA